MREARTMPALYCALHNVWYNQICGVRRGAAHLAAHWRRIPQSSGHM